MAYETCHHHVVECPVCGHIDRDVCEMFDEDEEDINTQCAACDKPITVSRRVIVQYTATVREA